MDGKPSRIYWDTSVFLCFLSEEEDQRRHICEDILHHAKDGEVEIITSMFTLVEVIRPKAIKHPVLLTDEQAGLLEGMFRWPWLKKIQVHEELALEAARLARITGLKPADAIHAATAIAEKVDQLQQWDCDFGKVAHLVTVTEPTYLSQLPLLQVRSLIGPTPSAFVGSLGEPDIPSQAPAGQPEQDPTPKALPRGIRIADPE